MLHLQYPIGKLVRPTEYIAADVQKYVEEIAVFPYHLRPVAESLSMAQLVTPYRPGGWTAAQVVHHVMDSHINAYTRFKLGLTEDNPNIKPYLEAAWAELPDAQDNYIHHSLALIEHLHARWAKTLQAMTDEQWQRTVYHPEHERTMPLYEFAAIYAWHGKHHLAHLQLVKTNNS